MNPRLAALPTHRPEPETPGGTYTDIEATARAFAISRRKLEELVAAGCPCLDLSSTTPGRRRRRCLRFCIADVAAWLAERNGGRP